MTVEGEKDKPKDSKPPQTPDQPEDDKKDNDDKEPPKDTSGNTPENTPPVDQEDTPDRQLCFLAVWGGCFVGSWNTAPRFWEDENEKKRAGETMII